MIQSYKRPKTLEEAIELLSRTDVRYVPMGGGSKVSRVRDENIGVVDLQSLGLDRIVSHGNHLSIGATVTLETLSSTEEIPMGLKKAIYLEGAANLRNQATIAGALMSAEGRSPFAAGMVALDTEMIWQPGDVVSNLGDWMAARISAGKLITSMRIPIHASLALESVARTPLDRPLVLVALSRWPSGRTRIVLGGWGNEPKLAFDGPDAGGAVEAVKDALSRAGDAWASVEYRQDTAAKLVARILDPGNRAGG